MASSSGFGSPTPLTAVGTLGMLFQVSANYSAAKADARALSANAEISLLQADETLARSSINISNYRKEAWAQVSGIEKAISKSGIGSSSGWALALMEDSAKTIATSVANMKREAAFENMMKKKEAENLRAQGKDTMKAAKTQRTGGYIMAAAKLFGG